MADVIAMAAKRSRSKSKSKSKSLLNNSDSDNPDTLSLKMFDNEKEIMLKIYEDFHNQNYEICGNLEITDNLIANVTHNERDKQENEANYKKHIRSLEKNKHLCRYEKHSMAIWHTHPKKIYPSFDDVAKVFRRPEINYSYIIHYYGYFKIIGICGEKIEFNESEAEQINKTLHLYYRPETAYGVTFFKEEEDKREIMNEYLKELNKVIKKIISDKGFANKIVFKIKFYVYKTKPRKMFVLGHHLR